MSPKVRWGLGIGLVAVGVLGTAVGSLYWATQYVPPFYQSAVKLDETVAQTSSDDMLRQTAALASDIRRGRPWQVVFTAEQINGWLAFDLPRNHPNLLPPEVRDPRVHIDDNQLEIALQWSGTAWSAVVSFQVEVYLQEANVVAIRIHQARAGKLPLPLGGLVESFVSSAQEAGMIIDQRQIDSDPVLLVTLPPTEMNDEPMLLEAVELRDGRIYLAGRSHGDTPALATRPDRSESK